MKVNLTSIMGFTIILLLGVIFLQRGCSTSENTRPPAVSIPIPEKKGIIPAPNNSVPEKVYVYVPVKEKADTTLLNAFRRENDSLKKELLYKEAITERTYVETFEDESIIMDVEVKTRGTLLGMHIPSYTIKESNILYQPPRNWNLYGGVELGIPTLPNTSFIAKVNLEVAVNNLKYSLSYDTERRVWGGLSLKLL